MKHSKTKVNSIFDRIQKIRSLLVIYGKEARYKDLAKMLVELERLEVELQQMIADDISRDRITSEVLILLLKKTPELIKLINELIFPSA